MAYTSINGKLVKKSNKSNVPDVLISDFTLGLHNGAITEDRVIDFMGMLNQFKHFSLIVPRKYLQYATSQYKEADTDWRTILSGGDDNARKCHEIYTRTDTVIIASQE